MSGCLTELLLFSHSLFCYSFRPFTYLFRITEKIVFDKSQPVVEFKNVRNCCGPVSYTTLRAHETEAELVCRLLLEKNKRDS